jgi:hypothetical protein
MTTAQGSGAVENVDQQIDEQEGERQDRCHALRREIARHDGLPQSRPTPGHEHGFGHCAPSRNAACRPIGGRPDQRVAQRVMTITAVSRRPLACGAHKVGSQHFQHGSPRQARDRADQYGAQQLPARSGSAGRRPRSARCGR